MYFDVAEGGGGGDARLHSAEVGNVFGEQGYAMMQAAAMHGSRGGGTMTMDGATGQQYHGGMRGARRRGGGRGGYRGAHQQQQYGGSFNGDDAMMYQQQQQQFAYTQQQQSPGTRMSVGSTKSADTTFSLPTAANSSASLSETPSTNPTANNRRARRGAASTFDIVPFPHEGMRRGTGASAVPDPLQSLTWDDIIAALRSAQEGQPPASQPPPPHIPPESTAERVTVVSECPTRSAGTWVWVAFRQSLWVVPPPFIYDDSTPVEEEEEEVDGSTTANGEEAGDGQGGTEDRVPRAIRDAGHYTEFRPPNAPESVRLVLIHYKSLKTMGADGSFSGHPRPPLPGPSTALPEHPDSPNAPSAPPPSATIRRPADVKLGGMCCDLPWQSVAHVITCATGIDIEMVDVFAASQSGRCCLWLRDPADTDLLLRRLVGRLWMAPACHGYAVLAPSTDSKIWLQGYLAWLRRAGITRVPFPRHLLTAERWRLSAADQRPPTSSKDRVARGVSPSAAM